MDYFAGGEVDHFNGLVPKRRHKKAVTFHVHRHVIDPAGHPRQFDGLHKFERRRRLILRRSNTA
jgi:hypothetical protein